jgi:DNA-binding HxlR family transcriptional regulator
VIISRSYFRSRRAGIDTAGARIASERFASATGGSQLMDVNAAGEAVRVLSGKGTLPVLIELACGARRHNELARVLDVDHKTLDKTLRRLQEARLVIREVTPAPLRVDYRLAPHARTVLLAIDDLATVWKSITHAGPDGPARRRPEPAHQLTDRTAG